jgi:hypothetical protein
MMIELSIEEARRLSPQALGVLVALRVDREEPFLPTGYAMVRAIRAHYNIGQVRAQGIINELRDAGHLKLQDDRRGRPLVLTG